MESCFESSRPQAELETVIIELLGELVVVLGLLASQVSLGGIRAKEARQVVGLSVALQFVKLFVLLAIVVRVNNRLRLLQLVIDQIVGGAMVALLKYFLGGAVSKEEVRLAALLVLNHMVGIVFVLLVILKLIRDK